MVLLDQFIWVFVFFGLIRLREVPIGLLERRVVRSLDLIRPIACIEPLLVGHEQVDGVVRERCVLDDSVTIVDTTDFETAVLPVAHTVSDRHDAFVVTLNGHPVQDMPVNNDKRRGTDTERMIRNRRNWPTRAHRILQISNWLPAIADLFVILNIIKKSITYFSS